MLDLKNIPTHIAIIMDGNGRWAEKRGIPRVAGHNAGVKAMKKIVKKSRELGIKYLTVYAFSTENWKRAEEEIGGIFKLLIMYVGRELKELNEDNIKVNVIGDYRSAGSSIEKAFDNIIEKTKNNTGLVFNIAFNYGSRQEICNSIKEIGRAIEAGEITSSEITEEMISRNLYTGKLNIPDPDLIIRTSGEERLSNYLLWQAAYSEMYVTEILWPDFTPEAYEESLATFGNRDRRYGGRK